MRIALLTCYLLLVTSAHALTDAWSVNVNDHTAVQRTYKRGESIDMRITLRDGLKPIDLTGATARWYWYTNAVDNLWWTNAASIQTPKSGLVSAPWTPAMDTGAALYPYWVGLWMPGATSPLWRVTGTIRLLGSPGLNPNSQPVPVRTLDFAAITITNAPWVTAADWASGSNALASALQDLSGRIDALPPPPVVPVVSVNGYTGAVSITAASLGALTAEADPVAGPRLDLIEPETNKWNAAYAWGDHALAGYLLPADLSPYATTQQVADAAAAIPRDRIVSADGSQWIDATGGVWRVVEGADGWALTLPSYPYEAHVGEIDWYAPSGYSEYADPGSWALLVESTGTGFDISVVTGFGEWGALDAQPISPITLLPVGMGAEGVVTLWLSGGANTSRVDTVALASQLPGIIMSNAVSQMTIYTNASGAATSWWQVASGVTNSGSFASGTPGAITNNWLGDTVKINNLKISQWPGGFETRAFIDCVDYYGFAFQGSLVFYFSPSGASFPYNKKCTFGGNEDSMIYNDGVDMIIDPDVAGSASVRIQGKLKVDENVTVSRTNTAAVVRSQSGYLMPNLGTNTTVSLIFTNGTIQAWEIAQ